MAHAICQNFEFKTTLCIIFHPSFFVSKRGRLVGMKSLWLISILLFTAFSEGLKRRPKGISRRNFGPKSKSLYSRIKNDLDGVENRIQLELKAISLKIDLKADSEDRPRPDEKLWDHRSICVEYRHFQKEYKMGERFDCPDKCNLCLCQCSWFTGIYQQHTVVT